MLEAILFASALVTVAADRCAEPPRIVVGVAALHGKVAEAQSFSLAEIEEMARRSRAVLVHPPLGFYSGGFGHDYQIRTQERAGLDGAKCGTLTTVTVRLALVDRTLEIARDLRERGCDRDAVARHYRKHAAADDQVLSRHVQLLNQALTAAWPIIREQLPASGTPDEVALRQVIEPVVSRTLEGYGQVRRTAFAEVDTGPEVLALASTCNGHT